MVNFNYNFSYLYSKNKTNSVSIATYAAKTLLHKIDFYLTPEQWLHSTVTLNRVTSNRGSFDGNFLDISLDKKLWKNKMLIELKIRNILNKTTISSQTVSALYKQETNIDIRGRELFFKIKYELR